MHAKTSYICLFLLSIFGGGCSKQREAPSEPISLSLCEIIKKPDRYNNVSVLVDVSLGLGRERSAIWDSKCGGSLIGLQMQQSDAIDPELISLCNRYRDSHQALTALIAGTFKYDRPHSIRQLLVSSFREIRVNNVRVYPK